MLRLCLENSAGVLRTPVKGTWGFVFYSRGIADSKPQEELTSDLPAEESREKSREGEPQEVRPARSSLEEGRTPPAFVTPEPQSRGAETLVFGGDGPSPVLPRQRRVCQGRLSPGTGPRLPAAAVPVATVCHIQIRSLALV